MISIGKSYKAGIIQIYSIIVKFIGAAILAYVGFGIIGVLSGYLIGDILFTVLVLPICYKKLNNKKEKIDINSSLNYSFALLPKLSQQPLCPDALVDNLQPIYHRSIGL